MTHLALVIPADDAVPPRLEPLALDDSTRLAQLQKIVGGYVTPISIGDIWLIVNEDGLPLGLPPNARALRYLMAFNIELRPGTTLVGNMVVVHSAGEEMVGASDEAVDLFCRVFSTDRETLTSVIPPE